MPFRPPIHHVAKVDTSLQHRLYRQHARMPHDPRSTAQWRRVREIVLARQPLCVDPYGVHYDAGRPASATEVDHIVPMQVNRAAWFDLENLQGLCKACHARKSGSERRNLKGRGVSKV